MPPSPLDSRHPSHRWWIALVLVLVLIPVAALSAGAQETLPGSGNPAASPIATDEPDEPSVPRQLVDALFLRPLGALSVAGGLVLFVGSSPLVLVSRVIDYKTSWDVCVVAPWEYTVERPLGDL